MYRSIFSTLCFKRSVLFGVRSRISWSLLLDLSKRIGEPAISIFFAPGGTAVSLSSRVKSIISVSSVFKILNSSQKQNIPWKKVLFIFWCEKMLLFTFSFRNPFPFNFCWRKHAAQPNSVIPSQQQAPKCKHFICFCCCLFCKKNNGATKLKPTATNDIISQNKKLAKQFVFQ